MLVPSSGQLDFFPSLDLGLLLPFPNQSSPPIMSTPPYLYQPLDKAKNEIRLVDIFPSADFDAPIELSITSVPFIVPPDHLLADRRQSLNEIAKTLPRDWTVEKTLNDRYIYVTTAGDDIRTSWIHPAALNFGEPPRLPPAGFQPKFEALSWTWGEQVDTEAAWVLDGEGNRSAYRLRQNLAQAMRYLRQASQPRRMWIDSIFIDQENKNEQGDQVLRMKDIYRLADRVVIWLGCRPRNPSRPRRAAERGGEGGSDSKLPNPTPAAVRRRVSLAGGHMRALILKGYMEGPR